MTAIGGALANGGGALGVSWPHGVHGLGDDVALLDRSVARRYAGSESESSESSFSKVG